MPFTADLPAWTPVEVPAVRPPAWAEPWATRIGIPGAVRLGMARRRAVAAIICALFVPVGAVRTVIGSSQPSTAVDPWGPLDPILIVLAVVGIVGVVVSLQGARRQRTNAVRSAQVLLKLANQQVTDFDLRPLLGSIRRFDAWAADRELVPLTSSDAGERASEEGARLMYAEADRGTRELRVERFGTTTADAFRASEALRVIGQVFVFGSLGGAAVGGLVALILITAGAPGAAGSYGIALIVLIVILIVGWIILSAVGRRRVKIAAVLYRELGRTDPNFTRSEAAALLARPYLYDLWLERHRAL